MSDRLTETTFRAWTGLLRAHEAVMDRVEAALKAAGLPLLSWYDALLELERAGEDGIRPAELEVELRIPQYALSRLLDRLESAGFVRRLPLPGDRRGQVVTITDAGRDTRRRMWPVYADAIQDAFGRRLTQNEAELLDVLVDRLL